MRLTVLDCKNAKAKDKAYKLSDGFGLYLYIKPNGRKIWRKKFYFAQKEQIFTIGDFPAISLNQARQEALEVRRLSEKGENPNDEKKKLKQKLVEENEHSFQAIAMQWHDKQCKKWSQGHAKRVLGRLERDVLPYIGKRALAR